MPDTQTAPRVQAGTLSLPVCDDFDGDCLDMTAKQAKWCYGGCQGHPCAGPDFKGLGPARGHCPILAATGSRN